VRPAAIALLVCALAAALEGVAGGPGVRQRLASLRVPRWALPFGAWLVVGGLYYVLCFIVLFRLLSIPANRLQTMALTVAVALMAANAAWNYIFFRRGNLYASFLFLLFYAALAVALCGLLLRVDSASAAFFGPYLLYFVYATAWGYKVWQLNRTSAE
jgi:tryptophan-rich sensory protein